MTGRYRPHLSLREGLYEHPPFPLVSSASPNRGIRAAVERAERNFRTRALADPMRSAAEGRCHPQDRSAA